eukprot:5916130-Amphidinium_carterae.1
MQKHACTHPPRRLWCVHSVNYVVSAVCQVITELGNTKLALRADGEHAIQAVSKAVKKIASVPRGSLASVGVVKRADRTVRLGEQV